MTLWKSRVWPHCQRASPCLLCWMPEPSPQEITSLGEIWGVFNWTANSSLNNLGWASSKRNLDISPTVVRIVPAAWALTAGHLGTGMWVMDRESLIRAASIREPQIILNAICIFFFPARIEIRWMINRPMTNMMIHVKTNADAHWTMTHQNSDMRVLNRIYAGTR